VHTESDFLIIIGLHISLCIPLFNDTVNSQVSEEHANVLEWAHMNGFVVNAKKCQSLFIRKSRDASDIELADAPTTDKIKFLGIFLNNKLTFCSHIQHVCHLSARRFYALRILKPLMETESLTVVYYGVVRSIIEYCSPAFGKLPENLGRMLDKLQNRCHRLICSVPHSSQCHCSRFPSLSTRRKHMATKLFLSAAAKTDHILHDIIPAKSIRSSRFIQPPSHTTRFRNSFVPFITMTLNGTIDC